MDLKIWVSLVKTSVLFYSNLDVSSLLKSNRTFINSNNSSLYFNPSPSKFLRHLFVFQYCFSLGDLCPMSSGSFIIIRIFRHTRINVPLLPYIKNQNSFFSDALFNTCSFSMEFILVWFRTEPKHVNYIIFISLG